MTIPIKKRIKTEIVIERTAALYILKSRIRDEINEGDWPMKLSGCRVKHAMHWKGEGMRDHSFNEFLIWHSTSSDSTSSHWVFFSLQGPHSTALELKSPHLDLTYPNWSQLWYESLLYEWLLFHQKTVQYWFFSWFWRSSLGLHTRFLILSRLAHHAR